VRLDVECGYLADVEATPELIESAWGRSTFDCGCPDVYFCPRSGEIECPRHSDFEVCCNDTVAHVPVPAETRLAHPRPQLPEAIFSREYTAMIGEDESEEWTARATVWATSLAEAREKLEARYGKGTVFLLRNEWDAHRLR